MIDLFIIEHSDGKYSLNDVMKRLYDEYLTSGYTEDDFQQLCVEYGGLKVSEVFSNHIYGIEDYTNTNNGIKFEARNDIFEGIGILKNKSSKAFIFT